MTIARFAPVLGFAAVLIGAAPPPAPTVVLAQPQDTCGLLTHDDVQALVPDEHIAVSDGAAAANQAISSYTCRYSWGDGVNRYGLAVNINPAARMFTGQNPDAIKLGLLSSVRAETDDATISDVGDAAVFKAYSSAYVGATAYVKERILQVTLDGFEAVHQRDAIVDLLKKAAAKL